jgi:cell fate (sporulation/competence/biofilm development) regulator YmcA (YheA/YmcA/DUF963 family)
MKLILFFSLIATAQAQLINDTIKDPAISARCRELLQERNDKVQITQRMKALLDKNNKLLKKIPEEKKTAKMTLDLTKTQLTNEIQLSQLKINRMEEDIVRQGCPGVSL